MTQPIGQGTRRRMKRLEIRRLGKENVARQIRGRRAY